MSSLDTRPSPATAAPSATASARPSAPAAARAGGAPVRVLLAELNYDGTVGGSHQALVDTVRNLDRARYEPVVLFYQANRWVDVLRAEGIEVHCWDETFQAEKAVYATGGRVAKALEHLRVVWRRWRFLRRQRIGLLHLNNSPWIGYDDWLPAGRMAGIPCVANGMGDVTGPGGWRRRVAASFDHVLPCSDMIAAAHRRDGVPADRITTVHLGVHLAQFRARVQRSRDEVRASLGVAPDEVLAVMVGNVRAWKGQHVVVEALVRMRPELRARLRVVFVGAVRPEDAEYHAAMERRLAEAGIADRATFVGGRTDIPDLVNAGEATIHSSTHPEPFGIVIIEGMALGRAVLAANAGGPREIFPDGEGFLHDPADPSELAAGLERLVADPAWRREMGERALRRAEVFDVPLMVQKIEGVYRRVLGG